MSDDLDVLARHLVAMAELDDGILTDSIQFLVSRADGVLVGLDHRIKGVDSLRRKLIDMLALDPDLELSEASERVHDVLRYTVVAEVDDYMAVLDALLTELQRQGTTVVGERNRWAGPGSGNQRPPPGRDEPALRDPVPHARQLCRCEKRLAAVRGASSCDDLGGPGGRAGRSDRRGVR